METASAAAGDDDFGRYRIVRTLGEGGMGTVYLRHRRRDRRFIKVWLHREMAGKRQ